MKIEMGESLIRTWIRHCMGCQMAELNWKPSPKWPAEITPELEQWFYEGKAQFSEDVFKKTSEPAQFLGQAEIDVLGIRVSQGKVEKIIAADIAFHTKGLQYGLKDATTARVIKKMFRTALTLERHFPGIPAKILFLSPKVTPSRESDINNAAQMLRTFFDGRRKHFLFGTIINNDFKGKVLDEIILLQNEVADTSELFLRAVQLVALFSQSSQTPPPKPTTTSQMPGSRVHVQTLPIELVPSDHKAFKILLLKHRKATRYEHYQDGRIEEKPWNATQLTEHSDIVGNLRSRKCYKQGAWQKRGMSKLVVKINSSDVQSG